MKPKRYPYTGRLKKPARLLIKEWQQYYDNYLQSLERREPTAKSDCKQSNDVDFKGRKKEPIRVSVDSQKITDKLASIDQKTMSRAKQRLSGL